MDQLTIGDYTVTFDEQGASIERGRPHATYRISAETATNAIDFMKQYGIQHVIDGIWVIGMALRNLGEFLNRTLVVHVVEMFEGLGVEGIRRPERKFLSLELKWWGLWRLLRPQSDGRKRNRQGDVQNQITVQAEPLKRANWKV